MDLLFFTDYGADPVWDSQMGAMIDLDELPITDEIRVTIRVWAADWERLAWQQMTYEGAQAGHVEDRVVPKISIQEWEEIDARGRVLCEALRAALGDGWRVGWPSHDKDGERRVQWETGGPLELHRYEGMSRPD